MLTYALAVAVAVAASASAAVAPHPAVNDVQTAPKRLEARLYNGRLSDVRIFPEVVSLSWESETYLCGGTLIDEYSVLTAAHCCMLHQPHNNRPISVRAGSNFHDREGVTSDVKQVVYHPGFVNETERHDVCVVKLKSAIPATWGNGIFTRYAQLSDVDVSDTDTDNKAVASWGSKTEKPIQIADRLERITVKVIDHKSCYDLHPNYPWDDVFCAIGEDSNICNGDSGSGLFDVYNGKVEGMLFGGGDCLRKPSAYVHVSKYLDFINKHKGNQDFPPSEHNRKYNMAEVPGEKLGQRVGCLFAEENGRSEEVVANNGKM